ncbi:hemerythrin domain-containing protein [Candidatus Venteria ishoeyi]|uniref:Anti-RNA polymerase sigma 70 factor n=1 Tax=Candidatus Venteria ishoeyi TaxID=1899563 RepID=A0A1H6FEX5_9GAMM|nr:hemerythrin domain-containing protein [Candidatus Venteria ishoeyi]MDM8545078.1 hemerythrin domain-containing protein [Candidatus Venteria ishoeyi]SEH07899.1 anti-RNA polymerase sigma 70 factor [Candidatus Venteria ishoeyi]
MFNWLKKKPTVSKPEEVSTEAKNTSSQSSRGLVKFHENLIDDLIVEHKELLNIYTAMLEGLDTKAYGSVAQNLSDFSTLLHAHLLKEHVELYVYLEYSLQNDEQTFQHMHEIRTEMDHISSTVMGFLHTYQRDPVSAKNAEAFKKSLSEIGEVLVSRIKREESSLYPLYKMA